MNRHFIRKLQVSLISLCLALAYGCTSLYRSDGNALTPYITETANIPDGDCSLKVRQVGGTPQPGRPLFIAVNGVPTTALIYHSLAEALAARLDASVLLVDLPGTGGSRLQTGHYSWTTQRACLRAYLRRQPAHTLIVHDVAGPILLPLLGDVPTIDRLVVFNSLLVPSEFSPPFPLNCLRSCLFLSRPLAYAAPFWFYEYRFRGIGIARNDQVDSGLIHALFDELHQDHGMGRLVDVMKGFELSGDSDRAIADGLAHDRPQLFIWGRRDPALGGELDKLATAGTQRQIHIIAQARHYPMLDFAAESADTITRWYLHAAH